MKKKIYNAAIPFYILFCFLAITLVSGCKQKKGGFDEKALHGSWKFDEKLPFSKLKELPDFKEDLEAVQDGEMGIGGKTTYNSNGQYSTNGSLMLKLIVNDSIPPVEMQFNFRETGKWKLTDSTLSEITEDGEVTPANEATKTMVEEDPSMLKDLRPMKGETTLDKINSVTPSSIELYDNMLHMKVVLKKSE